MKLSNDDCEFCFDLTELADALTAAGVYALLDEDNNVMYVGQSECMLVRVCHHIIGSDKHGVPKTCVKRIAVLALEEDKTVRLNAEEHYHHKLKPRYGKMGDKIYRKSTQDTKINNYKRRTLYKHGLASRVLPSMSIEEPDDALQEELRHLNTNLD